MGRTARSMPPNLLHAPAEEETLAQWLRRQRRADRKPIPPRGVTQTAPARVLDAMAAAINKKTTPVAADAVETQRNEKPMSEIQCTKTVAETERRTCLLHFVAEVTA